MIRNLTILYDEPSEEEWFRSLSSNLRNAKRESITAARGWSSIQGVLAYDRPDIILLHDETPILVVEETVEVPSGHNVGQRFARIAAAAECGVPCLYFGPYVAKKHGGKTAGPRYMNLRLFSALDAMVRTRKTAITTINWPVDERCEVRRGREKDADVREYMATFFNEYEANGLPEVNASLLTSDIHCRMISERNAFVAESVRSPEQYDGPPPSVELLSIPDFSRRFRSAGRRLPLGTNEVVLYNVGMRNIRSDPYTGMAMLYRYLYVLEDPSRSLILWFPNITQEMWWSAAARGNRKDIKIFRIAADAIIFSDGLLMARDL